MIKVRDTTGARGRDTTQAPITSVAKPHAWGTYYIASRLTPQSSASKQLVSHSESKTANMAWYKGTRAATSFAARLMTCAGNGL